MTISEHPETKPNWWKEATVYQIYPASFKDSNNDGWGDLKGISTKLPYLKDLGVDAIWVCPFYDSPQQDMGYDISNYEKVWPTYGTNEECFELIEKTHSLGMKFVTDLVINHCSIEHPWFKESRSSKTNPKRDWFFWRPPRGYDSEGKPIPPNNWRSFFSGSAWSFDPTTDEFYLRLFASGQPDFNWENEECRKALFDTSIGFWLDHGVDGFRIDTAGLYSKVPSLPDSPITDQNSYYQDPNYGSHNGPRIHEFHREINRYIANRVKDNRLILTVGEVGQGDDQIKISYTGSSRNEMSELFDFSYTDLGTSPSFRYNAQPFTLKEWKIGIAKAFKFIERTDAWSTIYMENHDQPRSVTRFGDDSPKYRQISAKLLAMLEVALTGTLYVYQGQELGQINFKNWPIEKYEDVDIRNNYAIIKEKHGENSVEMKKFYQGIGLLSRDHARTPMPWTSEEPNAGFTDAEAQPWFHLNESFTEGINVASESKDPESVLNFWREALKFRKNHKDVAVYGYDFGFIDLDSNKLFSFAKRYENTTLFAALNFSSAEIQFTLPDNVKPQSLALSNVPENEVDPASTTLRAWEGRIYVSNQG